MISEIGSQIDLLEHRVTGSIRDQSAEQQQQLAEVVTSQDDKIADLETKLYSLGTGVADLEQSSSSQLGEVRAESKFSKKNFIHLWRMLSPVQYLKHVGEETA